MVVFHSNDVSNFESLFRPGTYSFDNEIKKKWNVEKLSLNFENYLIREHNKHSMNLQFNVERFIKREKKGEIVTDVFLAILCLRRSSNSLFVVLFNTNIKFWNEQIFSKDGITLSSITQQSQEISTNLSKKTIDSLPISKIFLSPFLT
jgi:hypothetical protein